MTVPSMSSNVTDTIKPWHRWHSMSRPLSRKELDSTPALLRSSSEQYAMREAILRDFFLGLCSVQQLRNGLEGSAERSAGTSQYHIEDMDTGFEVKPEHLIALCDAILSGELPSESLQAVGVCLINSDHFGWDSDTEPGSRVSATVHDWSSPETNDPLTMEHIRKFRERLSPGRDSGR